MFQIGNVQRITKYLLICALTLSSECQAAVNRDDNIYYFTTGRPSVQEQFTVPTYAPQFVDSPTEVEDRTIFFVVLSLSVIFIALLSYLCQKSSDSSGSSGSSGGSNYRVAGAVVHPPPRHLAPPSTMPTAPVLSHGNSRPMMVSFVNTGYQSDSSVVDGGVRSGDVPPDYAAVAIGDLTTAPERSKFPTVMPRMETPPPKYQDGQPFSK